MSSQDSTRKLVTSVDVNDLKSKVEFVRSGLRVGICKAANARYISSIHGIGHLSRMDDHNAQTYNNVIFLMTRALHSLRVQAKMGIYY